MQETLKIALSSEKLSPKKKERKNVFRSPRTVATEEKSPSSCFLFQKINNEKIFFSTKFSFCVIFPFSYHYWKCQREKWSLAQEKLAKSRKFNSSFSCQFEGNLSTSLRLVTDGVRDTLIAWHDVGILFDVSWNFVCLTESENSFVNFSAQIIADLRSLRIFC